MNSKVYQTAEHSFKPSQGIASSYKYNIGLNNNDVNLHSSLIFSNLTRSTLMKEDKSKKENNP